MVKPSVNILDEMYSVMNAAREQHITLRLLGGLAIWLHSPRADRFGLVRDYPDLDFVAKKGDQRRLEDFFGGLGYLPVRRFNLLHGDRRQIYDHPLTGRRVDVFIGDFEMCHKVPLEGRLHIHEITIPLAELFLTKAQIVELNQKDLVDLVALLLDNAPGQGDDGVINVNRIAELCANDWGLFTTLCRTLDKIEQHLPELESGIDALDRQLILERIEVIRAALKQSSKSLRWRARNRIGTRLRWYAEVEEINR